MRVLEIPMSPEGGRHLPYMTALLQETMPQDPPGHRLPTVLVYPGGGYKHLSPREADPIAMEFAARGYQVFILYYTVDPARYPTPLIEGARAMALIREHADEWLVDPGKIAVCGFSAGGHAAGLLSCLWNDEAVVRAGIDPEQARPNASILCYSVLTSKPGYCHEGSFENLLCEDLDAKRGEMALETRVSALTPPTFLWHTATDQAVPVESSIWYARALAEHGVPFELHIFPNGPHGLALGRRRTAHVNEPDFPDVVQWMRLCCEWLHRLFGL